MYFLKIIIKEMNNIKNFFNGLLLINYPLKRYY